MRVYTTAGAAVTAPTALNGFLGYPPAIIRSTVTFGPFVTDPSCLYDAATGHWFLDVLTLDTFPKVGSEGAQPRSASPRRAPLRRGREWSARGHATPLRQRCAGVRGW